MADENGRRQRIRHKPVKKKAKKLRYFYLNGELHKSLHINRGKDYIQAWSYPQAKRVGYTYSDVKRNMEKAFTTAEVGEILNRGRLTLSYAIRDGDIEMPQYIYFIEDPERKILKYMWHEKDIMAMHEVLSNRHYGKPRKDGETKPFDLPSAREVQAIIRHNLILYAKTEDGEFVPTWEAEKF